MAKCISCGCEFDVSSARRSISRRYGAGTYDDYYPNADMCAECADSEISADMGTGAEIAELMGDSWLDD